MNKFITSLVLILLNIALLYSQVQRISGQTISGNVNWRGTIIISGDVIIAQKSRLVIEPGTKVLFEPNRDETKGGADKTRSEIIVKGTLLARGIPGRKVTFSSNSASPRMGDWYGMEILHIKSGTLLEFCVIEYAHNGLKIKNSKILINNCEIRYNYDAGIRTEVKASPEINNCIISENGYAGLICELGSKPILKDNLISLNNIGVVVFSLSQPNLGNMAPGDNFNPGRNSIFNNEEFNLYNHSNKKIIAENNHWGDENRSSIAEKVYDGTDNSKFGLVDFMPILKQSSQQNLGTMLLLAQETKGTPTVPSSAPVQNRPRAASVKGSSPVVKDTSSQNLLENTTVEKEYVSDETLDLSKKLEEMAPLMASAAPSEPIVRQLAVDSKEVKNKIDYNQIFLELFLDGGKKNYVNKPTINSSKIPRNFWKEGEVRVKVIVDKEGQVESASVLRGINDIIDEVVLETVNSFEYQSGYINGQAVKFSTSEVFRFK
jgi:TonB family protein